MGYPNVQRWLSRHLPPRMLAIAPSLTTKAILFGLVVFLSLAAAIIYVANFVKIHVAMQLERQLQQEASELGDALAIELQQRITVLDQVASFWIYSDTVTPLEFSGYMQRLLLHEPDLFYDIAYADPSLIIQWAEPEARAHWLVGIDQAAEPGRFPGMNAQTPPEITVIGNVHDLSPIRKPGFKIITPIYREKEFLGLISGTIEIGSLLSRIGSETLLLDHNLAIMALNQAGITVYRNQSDDTTRLINSTDEISARAILDIQNLKWEIILSTASDDSGSILSPHRILLLVGLSAALALGLSMAILWLGKQRLRISQFHLETYAHELEDANKRNQEAIAMLELANQRLSATNSQLETANAQLLDLNRDLDDFNHVVSHDLKEPLRGIQAFSQFLLEDYGDKLEDQGKGYVNNLMSAATRMQLLINALLQLAKVARTKTSLQNVSMESIIANALDDLSFQINSRNVMIEIAPHLPSVWADPIHLQIVVRNIISNGIKYNVSEIPKIKISWQNRRDSFEFQFKDNGIGIDSRYHKRIFGLFERLVAQDAYEGTGAGLAICKKIVEQGRGMIWVESQPNNGSTFFFTLPKSPTPDSQHPPPIMEASSPDPAQN